MTKEKMCKNDDFEVLCGLLSCIVSSKYAKQIADCLLKKYGTLSNVISKPLDELLSVILGFDDNVEMFLQVIYAVARRVHEKK